MKKTTAYILAAALAVAALSGCDNKPAVTDGQNSGLPAAQSGEQTDTAVSAETRATAKEIADTIFPGDASSFATWADIDKNTIVASIDSEEYGDYFNITFDEFFKEYAYHLVISNISDDMSDEYKEQCMTYRDNIINYLMYERMFLYEAEHTYGISEDKLTEEQKTEIMENVEQVKNNAASSFYDTVSEKLGTAVTIDDINATCREVLNVLLNKCGLDDSIFYRWELNQYIQELLTEELTKDVSISDSQVEEMYASFVDEAKEIAENNTEEYESSSIYMMAYVPEGTRCAKHILLSFDDDALSSVADAVSRGSDEEVKTLVESAYTDELKAKAKEVSERIASGEDFSSLQSEYGSIGEDEYVVLKNSSSFFDEYKNALYALENKGDISEPVVCQNGVYFIQYSDDAKVSDDGVKQIKDNMREYLTDLESNVVQSDAYNEWTEKYSYTVDNEMLMI